MTEELDNRYVKNCYDEFVGEMDGEYSDWRWFSGPEQRFHHAQTERALRRALGRDVFDHALELGPGDGIWSQMLIQQANHLVLLDQSKEMLKKAKSRLEGCSNIEFENADFLEWPGEQRFDLLIGVRCFEYFDDKPKAVEKMFELLNPGGRLVLVSKNPRGLAWRTRASSKLLHTTQIPREDMVELLDQAGFKVRAVFPGTYGLRTRYRVMRRVFRTLHKLVLRSRHLRAVPVLSTYPVESWVYVANRP